VVTPVLLHITEYVLNFLCRHVQELHTFENISIFGPTWLPVYTVYLKKLGHSYFYRIYHFA